MATLLDVWPNPEVNETVTLDNGTVITADGATVTKTDEIDGLVREGALLSRDSEAENPNPSPLPPVVVVGPPGPSGPPGPQGPPGSGGGGLFVNTIADLAALAGGAAGQVATLLGYYTPGDGGGGNFYWNVSSTTPTNGGTVIGSAPTGRWLRLHPAGEYHVDWFGFNATDCIQRALDTAFPSGTVTMGPRTYSYPVSPIIRGSVSLLGQGSTTTIKLTAATVGQNDNFLAVSEMGTNEVTFGTGTLAVGDRTFTVVGDLTGWVPGDDVFCFFGSDPGDPNEWYVKYFDIVESVVGQVVTLRVGVSEAIPNPFTFSNRIIKPASICQNCQIGNFATDMTPGIIQNITGNVIFGRNVVVRDIFIRSSNGPVGQSNCENVEFRNIYARHVDRNAHSAAGGVISFNGCRNASARNIFAEDIERFAVYLETQCRGVLIENLHISYGSDASPGAGSDAMISIGGGCTGVVVRRGTFTSTVQDKQVVSYFGTSSLLARTEDFTLAGPRVLAMSLGTHFGYFEHGGIKRERRTWSNTIRYVAGQNVSFSNLPVGMLAAIRVYSSTAFLASQAFLQDTATFNGINITALFSPPAQTNGQEVFNTAQVNGTDTHRLDVLFDAGLAAGGYATIEIDYFARLDSFDNGSQALKQRTDYSPTGAVRLGGHTVMYGTAVPVAAQGSFSVGDRVFNATAAVGSPKGWICTVAGTPGTWVSEGNL